MFGKGRRSNLKYAGQEEKMQIIFFDKYIKRFK